MKVLVVDDDVVSRMVLMHLIDSSGKFDIQEAEDGEDAWQQLAAGLRPAIIFCDLRMPRLSGLALLGRVRTDSGLKNIPFVLVSSANDTDTVDAANATGVSGYIVKPFQAEQVRVHLAPFMAGQGGGLKAEEPRATMQRLGINAERLQLYLGGFQNQLTAAGGEIDVLLSRGEQAGARARIDRLQAGCLTLGLDGAADALRAIPGESLQSDAVHQVLADVVRAVMVQSETLKRSAA
ncbi:MAG: response regulator [Pseudomonadota bacterium]